MSVAALDTTFTPTPQPIEAGSGSTALSSIDFCTTALKVRLAQAAEQAEVDAIYAEVITRYQDFCAKNPALVELKLAYLHNTPENIDYNSCTLGSNGVKLIIDHLSNKIPQFRCYYCANKEELRDSIAQMVQSAFTGKVAIIYKKIAHTISLLFEKTDTHFYICIADPAGSGKGTDLDRDFLLEIISELHSSLDAQIYILTLKRHYSLLGCSTFSLHDATQFFYMERFFEDLNKNSLDTPHPSVHLVKHLPPRLMRIAQRMKEIDSYIAAEETGIMDAGTDNSYPITSYGLNLSSNNHKSFALSLTYSTRNYDTGRGTTKHNMRLHDKLFRYVYIIIQYMERYTAEELRDRAAQHELSKIVF